VINLLVIIVMPSPGPNLWTWKFFADSKLWKNGKFHSGIVSKGTGFEIEKTCQC
jgi:hypothetical protein